MVEQTQQPTADLESWCMTNMKTAGDLEQKYTNARRESAMSAKEIWQLKAQVLASNERIKELTLKVARQEIVQKATETRNTPSKQISNREDGRTCAAPSRKRKRTS